MSLTTIVAGYPLPEAYSNLWFKYFATNDSGLCTRVAKGILCSTMGPVLALNDSRHFLLYGFQQWVEHVSVTDLALESWKKSAKSALVGLAALGIGWASPKTVYQLQNQLGLPTTRTQRVARHVFEAAKRFGPPLIKAAIALSIVYLTPAAWLTTIDNVGFCLEMLILAIKVAGLALLYSIVTSFPF